MSRSEALLAVAAREIGYHESPGKRNKFGAYYKCDGAAWCMFFVQWCYEQADMKLPLSTGSCGELLRWYRANHPECVTDDPVPGCIVIFDFPGGAATDHTGLFVSRTDTTVTTIDGNTSGTNQSNGGWVQQKMRAVSYAKPTYIVPRALISGEAAEKEDNPMEQRYDSLADISEKAPWATETVSKLIERGGIRGSGVRDAQGRPADMDLTRDMLRVLVMLDRAGAF